MKFLRRSFTTLAATYGVLVSLFTLGGWLVPDTWPMMALYATGAQFLLLGAAVLLPITLIIGMPRRAAWALSPAVAVFLVLYGGQFFPWRASEPAGQPGLRVMTYNIMWRDSDYQATIDIIRAADADVVALQEVSPESEQLLRDALSDTYPYMALDGNSNGYIGAGFLSRFPILESTYLLDSFGNQRVLVDVDGTPIVFYNMHASIPRGMGRNLFAFDISNRTSDINVLLERVGRETERVVVLGDFNMADMSDSYQDLTHVLVDSYRQVGWGMGWTHAGPLVRIESLFGVRFLRIDYIFVQPDGLRPLNAQVWQDSGGSDHLPVVATLEFRERIGNQF